MVIVLALLVVVFVLVVLGTAYRRRHADPADMKRVGDEPDLDPHEAARRAQGNSAWARGDLGL